MACVWQTTTAGLTKQIFSCNEIASILLLSIGDIITVGLAPITCMLMVYTSTPQGCCGFAEACSTALLISRVLSADEVSMLPLTTALLDSDCHFSCTFLLVILHCQPHSMVDVKQTFLTERIKVVFRVVVLVGLCYVRIHDKVIRAAEPWTG